VHPSKFSHAIYDHHKEHIFDINIGEKTKVRIQSQSS